MKEVRALKALFTWEAETIEQKVERLLDQKEPIESTAPEIFTERKDGVLAAYNIRTDRFELAADAIDVLNKNAIAKRAEAQKKADEAASGKVVGMDGKEAGKDSSKEGGGR